MLAVHRMSHCEYPLLLSVICYDEWCLKFQWHIVTAGFFWFPNTLCIFHCRHSDPVGLYDAIKFKPVDFDFYFLYLKLVHLVIDTACELKSSNQGEWTSGYYWRYPLPLYRVVLQTSCGYVCGVKPFRKVKRALWGRFKEKYSTKR